VTAAVIGQGRDSLGKAPADVTARYSSRCRRRTANRSARNGSCPVHTAGSYALRLYNSLFVNGLCTSTQLARSVHFAARHPGKWKCIFNCSARSTDSQDGRAGPERRNSHGN
jgi:hypothetical protein